MTERRSSSATLQPAPFPSAEVAALRRALNATYRVTPAQPIASLAASCSTLLTSVVESAGLATLAQLAAALRLAVEATSLRLGSEVDDAACAIRTALGVSGATSKDERERIPTPPCRQTPYTGGEKGER